MSKPKPRKPTTPEDQDIASFEFSPVGLDLKWTKDMITVFDGYRIHRCFDLTFIEKAIGQGELPRTFIDQWRFIRTILHRFAGVAPKIPGVLKQYERRQLLRYIATFLMVIAVPSIVATYVFSLTFIAWITLPITAIAVVFFIAQWTAGHYINLKTAKLIETYWADNPGLLRAEHLALKAWTQRLIANAKFRLRKDEALPEKNPIKFYNDDYEGIVVKATPNWYRKHFVVHIAI
ncbi:MAG: hypothetical protein ACFFEF_09145 [Candidatus Thorarchaeota archaeon]